MPGKKTTKLWVPDDEVSPETLAKVRTPRLSISYVWPLITYLDCLPSSVCICCIAAEIELQVDS